MQGTVKDLELLITSRYPLIALLTYEEERAEELLRRVAASLNIPLYLWTVTEGLRRSSGAGAGQIYDTQHPLKALGNLAAVKGEGLYLFKGLDRYLEDPEILRKLQDLAQQFARDRRAIVLLAAWLKLPAELEKLTANFRLELPTEDELKLLVKGLVNDLSRQHRIKVDLSQPEFNRLAEALKGLTAFEAERALTKAVLDDLALTGKDIERIIQTKKELLEREGVLEYTPAEEGMAQVGGLGNLKRWLEKRSRAFTPEAKSFGVPPPKGIILLGVQGCGKSMAAKAVAREWGLPLLKLEPGRLYDKYVGESDKNLEQALKLAERMSPCVLLLDEIEKGFASAGSAEADAGLSRRIFGRLLGWLQDRAAPVFIVATCNDITQLPPELMRKGRFDEIFFLDLPGAEERKEIFAVHLRKRGRDPAAFDLNLLAAAAAGFSGAEIEQAIVSSLYTAFAGTSELTTAHIIEEIAATKPLSVTRAEEITALRQWAAGRAVMAQ